MSVRSVPAMKRRANVIRRFATSDLVRVDRRPRLKPLLVRLYLGPEGPRFHGDAECAAGVRDCIPEKAFANKTVGIPHLPTEGRYGAPGNFNWRSGFILLNRSEPDHFEGDLKSNPVCSLLFLSHFGTD
jgi:hypothetical protein